MAYIDTSVWVAALCREPFTARVQSWLEKQAAGALHVSGWVQAEFASALAMKQRIGHLDAPQALHLALAARGGLALVTLDTLLAKAAVRFGVQARLLQEELA